MRKLWRTGVSPILGDREIKVQLTSTLACALLTALDSTSVNVLGYLVH